MNGRELFWWAKNIKQEARTKHTSKYIIHTFLFAPRMASFQMNYKSFYASRGQLIAGANLTDKQKGKINGVN